MTKLGQHQGTSQVELDVGSAPTTSGHKRFEQGDGGIIVGSTCRSTRGRQRRGAAISIARQTYLTAKFKSQASWLD